MDPSELHRQLAAIGGPGPCTDAERRAGRLLARALRERGRRPRTETVWVRPGWPGVWLVYAVLGVAGSVVSVDHAAVALGLTAAAALLALVELSGRVRALSALAPKRATQNVIAGAPEGRAARERRREAPMWSGAGAAGAAEAAEAGDGRAAAATGRGGAGPVKPVHLILTAGYDAPRLIPPTTRVLGGVHDLLARLLGGRLAHPLGLLALTLVALAALAGARLAGAEGTVLGAVQLVPTVVCILATALLAEVAFAVPREGDNANASAAVAALQIADELDRSPPRHLTVEVVLAGAADAQAAGMHAFARARRKQLREQDVAVIHVEPAGAGTPIFWTHDGPLLAARMHPQLVRAARHVAEHEQHLGAQPHRGHGVTGALAARRSRWPAIAVGASQPAAETSDPAATRAVVELAVGIVRRLDHELSGR